MAIERESYPSSGTRANGPPALREYLGPIAAGLAVVAVGLLPWTLLARANRTTSPDVPWAALLTVAYVIVLLAWLHGLGPPGRTAARRRRRLRLWRPTPVADRDAGALSVTALVLLLAALYVLWILSGRLSPVPDLSAYPTTSYRWSMFIMGGLLSGVLEEAAYRGYMQTGLERVDPERAIVITSLVFVASHITQGLLAVIVLGPGMFAASVLYGLLARRTGTILAGMVIHVAGDLSYTFFGVLRGNPAFLFAS